MTDSPDVIAEVRGTQGSERHRFASGRAQLQVHAVRPDERKQHAPEIVHLEEPTHDLVRLVTLTFTTLELHEVR
jgi:hypothetical protein